MEVPISLDNEDSTTFIVTPFGDRIPIVPNVSGLLDGILLTGESDVKFGLYSEYPEFWKYLKELLQDSRPEIPKPYDKWWEFVNFLAIDIDTLKISIANSNGYLNRAEWQSSIMPVVLVELGILRYITYCPPSIWWPRLMQTKKGRDFLESASENFGTRTYDVKAPDIDVEKVIEGHTGGLIGSDFPWSEDAFLSGGMWANIFFGTALTPNSDVDIFLTGDSAVVHDNKRKILEYIHTKSGGQMLLVINNGALNIHVPGSCMIQLICMWDSNSYDVINHFDLPFVRGYWCGGKTHHITVDCFVSQLTKKVRWTRKPKLLRDRYEKCLAKGFSTFLIDNVDISDKIESTCLVDRKIEKVEMDIVPSMTIQEMASTINVWLYEHSNPNVKVIQTLGEACSTTLLSETYDRSYQRRVIVEIDSYYNLRKIIHSDKVPEIIIVTRDMNPSTLEKLEEIYFDFLSYKNGTRRSRRNNSVDLSKPDRVFNSMNLYSIDPSVIDWFTKDDRVFYNGMDIDG